MHRFFIDVLQGDVAYLDAEDETHARKALRLRTGDEVLLCDGAGRQCHATIETMSADGTSLRCGEWRPLYTEAAMRLTLYQSLPKTGKLEHVLQKGTELGIAGFGLFASDRCEVRNARPKIDRLARVIREASRQSGRARIPDLAVIEGKKGQVGGTTALIEALARHEVVLWAYEGENRRSLRDAFDALAREGLPTDIALVVGPEGGFSPEEAEALRAAGALSVSLGRRILRTETAGPAMAAMLLYAAGDMEPSCEREEQAP